MSTRAELGDDPRDRRVDLRAVGDVAAHRERAPPEGADLLDRRLGVHHALCHCGLRQDAVLLGRGRVGLDEDVRDRDVGARARERQRVGAAQAARAAGDERDAAG